MRLRSYAFSMLLTAAVLALVSCTSPPVSPPSAQTPIPADPVFPMPPTLRPQVTFWQNVYAVWGRGQVALHDNRYLDLVYEVVTLPSPVDESYTESQKLLLKTRYDTLKALLGRVEYKVAQRLPLTPEEQRLAARVQASSGGPAAIAGVGERLRSQRGLRELFKRGLEISGRYDGLFRQIFREAGLPEDLAFLPHVESSFQNHATSSVGAAGMWQFMPTTARQLMMLNEAVDERRDPVASAQGAARYLSDAYSRLGSWPLAITAYNHGVGGMLRAKQQFGDDIGVIVQNYVGKGFGFASRNFYAEFLAARTIARNPRSFFPEGLSYEPPLNLDRIRLRQAAVLSTLADHYEVSPHELIALNQAWNPPVQTGRLPLPAGAMVWLPAGTIDRLAQRGMADRALVLAEPLSTAQLR